MGAFAVRAGPHPGAERATAASELATALGTVRAHGFKHTPTRNAYEFVIEAPTTTGAFRIVTTLLRQVYGQDWWAEVEPLPHFN
jgi:hypothetical protein